MNTSEVKTKETQRADVEQHHFAHLVVGTFTHPSLHVLALSTGSDPSLTVTQNLTASGKHSWLALDRWRNRVYATSWTDNDADPCVVGYQLSKSGSKFSLKTLGSQIIDSRSGYVALGPQISSSQAAKVLYSVGGPSGEVFALKEDGSFGAAKDNEHQLIKDVKGSEARIQEIDFVHGGRISAPGQRLGPPPQEEHDDQDSTHKGAMAFGGLRHGSHSVDVGPPKQLGNHTLRPVYVADIGRNSTFIYTTDVNSDNGTLRLARRVKAPQKDDGPRHVWPHPNGQIVYVVEEHSSVIDVYHLHWDEEQAQKEVSRGFDGETGILDMEHLQRVSILPPDQDAKLFWADEVRLSPEEGSSPRWLFGSTRGLEPRTKGCVTLFELDDDGLVRNVSPSISTQHSAYTDIYETPTSGGWANAIEPCPWLISDHQDDTKGSVYAALTDSEQGLVIVLKVALEEGASKHAVVEGHLQGEVQGTVRGHVQGEIKGNLKLSDIVDNRVKSDVNSESVDNQVDNQLSRKSQARLVEVASTSLGNGPDGKVRGAATAVWLAPSARQ
ncbi:unnamed protein product [Sympodiomycopsis kandeliae]